MHNVAQIVERLILSSQNVMNRLPISVIILTYNEEENIEVCFRSVYDWVKDIFIVDSYSSDRTLEIARKYTNDIYVHRFENHAKQLNWALTNIPISTEWIMRLDADEHVTPELAEELKRVLLHVPTTITGLYVKRRVHFMGRWIKHGGYYPVWLLRVFRKGACVCEERWMDEHMQLLNGRAVRLRNDIIDENRNVLHWWVGKHNDYATREAIDILLSTATDKRRSIAPKLGGTQDQRRRWQKQNVYLKLPLFLRAFAYFTWRYFIRFGFLDGKKGLIWHYLQGFWYRFLVDSKIYEIKQHAKRTNSSIRQTVKEIYGIDVW